MPAGMPYERATAERLFTPSGPWATPNRSGADEDPDTDTFRSAAGPT